MPCRWAWILLLPVSCGDDGSGDGSTATPTTSLTGTADSTSRGSDTDDPATGTDPPGSTTSGCTPGLPGCSCLPDDTCMGDALCEGGTCQDPAGTDTTGDTTTGDPPDCVDASCLCSSVPSPLLMGTGTIAVAAGNLDGDPALDLVAANRDANSVSVRTGNGDGTFFVEDSFPTGTTPIAIGVGDFTGDDLVDVVTANQGTFDASLLAGNGVGSLVGAGTLAIGTMLVPTDLSVVDIDNDGDPELLITENTSSTLLYYTTEGGMVLPPTPLGVGMGVAAIHMADFSGNGAPDAITANAVDGGVSLLLSNGSGVLGAASSFTVGSGPIRVDAGNFSDDEFTDAVVANAAGSITLLVGNGRVGSFGAPLPLVSAPGGIQALIAEDFDLDGDTDIAVAGSDSMVHLYLGDGNSGVSLACSIALFSPPADIIAADLNEDGLLDLITANPTANGLSLILTNA